MARLVTIFGGAGFVGRYVVQALLREGARVRVVGRDPKRAFFVKPLGGLGQTQFIAADITKPATVARAVAGSDSVINLVGILTGAFEAIHVEGARIVAEEAAKAGVGALVYLSAIGADPNSPSAYGRSKAGGEAAVRAAFPAATILRPSIVFGAEDAFVNRFARMMQISPIVPIISGGTRFQPVYVADVAEAIAAAALDPAPYRGQLYELGGPEILSMTELHRTIAAMVGRTPTFVDLPDGVSVLLALPGFLPGAPLTMDQWRMLHRDNVVTAGSNGLDAFGLSPTPLAGVAPRWLVRYRRHGRFGAERKAL